MSIIKREISVSNENRLNGYFPARTNSGEDAFDWEVAKGIVVRNLYNRTLSAKLVVKDAEAPEYSKFRDVCKEDFLRKLDEPEFWDFLEEMYFSPDDFYTIAPECLLFKISSLSASSPKNRLGDLFSSLMQECNNEDSERLKRNFLEDQVVSSLRADENLISYSGSKYSKKISEKPFLPFLSESFQKDILFLSDHPAYLIQNLELLLKLYGYLYTSQLALNIDAFTNEPSSRPLYFILENETASLERTDLVRNGHQKVAAKLDLIFPYLTMTETLYDVEALGSRIPLWELAAKLTESDVDPLKTYAREFSAKRNLAVTIDESNPSPVYWLRKLLDLSLMQFAKGETREAAQGKFIKSTEAELCGTFVRPRGRAGKILVLNQDYLVLLTNLAIGDKQRLRLHELIEEFNARGVYFDKKTQQSLIRFYERVGNVERMSDSGDAVYVRKTI